MKILYVITKSNWGGAQRHVYDLAVSMKEKGHTAVVALGGEGILRKRLEDAGIKTHSISRLGRDVNVSNDAGSFKEIYDIIRRERPDVLHLHSTKAGGIGALAGRLAGTPKIIYTVHGWAFNEDRPLWWRLSVSFFSWLTMLLCHRVILIAEREYAQALHFPGVRAKLTLIPPGIKPPIFMSVAGAQQTLAKAAGLTLAEFNKRIIIGTISELHPNKGLPYLLAALEHVVREHPSILCLIIGDGQDRDMLSALIQEMKLEHNVKLLGFVYDASHYLKGFTMFVLSSVKEGLPYVLLEAGCASLPTIATTVGGIPEVVEDMKSGVLVQSRNYRELAHALSFMIEHPAMRKQYGAALRESVLKNFSLERMVEKVENIYTL